MATGRARARGAAEPSEHLHLVGGAGGPGGGGETARGALARSGGRDDRAAGRDAAGASGGGVRALGRSAHERARRRTEDGARGEHSKRHPKRKPRRAGARSHALDAEGDAGAPGAGARVRRRAVSLSGVGDDARGWCARGARDPRTSRSRVQRTRWVFAVATARRRFRATQCGGDAPARDRIRDDAATAVDRGGFRGKTRGALRKKTVRDKNKNTL